MKYTSKLQQKIVSSIGKLKPTEETYLKIMKILSSHINFKSRVINQKKF